MISWISVSNWIILSFEKGEAEKKRKKNQEKKKSFIHLLTHKHMSRTQTGDLCNFKPSHSSISLSSGANRRTGVCQRSLYQPSLLTVPKGVPHWSILVFGNVRGLSKWVGVSGHHCLNRHSCGFAKPRRQLSGKIGFCPMAIRGTVKADSSLLTKA